MDYWFSTCDPCKWSEKHSTEDAAIAAVEDHIQAQHARVRSPERAAQRIGLVQNRTDVAEQVSPGKVAAEDAGVQNPQPPVTDTPSPAATPEIPGLMDAWGEALKPNE